MLRQCELQYYCCGMKSGNIKHLICNMFNISSSSQSDSGETLKGVFRIAAAYKRYENSGTK